MLWPRCAHRRHTADSFTRLPHNIRRGDTAAGGIVTHDVDDLLEQLTVSGIDYHNAARNTVSKRGLSGVCRRGKGLRSYRISGKLVFSFHQLNALPKTALGPVFIVWIGAGTGSIIAMTVAISLFVTILNMHVGFLSTDREKIRLMQTLGATRHQILWRLVIPANYATLFNTLRVNVGLSWVGVIMGEFLVSKAGLGYLIVYGSQVFNMDLVMATVFVLAAAAVVMYQLVLWLEKGFKNRLGVTQ